MGGNLAVTIITEDGEMYKMNRWTNSLPDFVNNMKFVQKDKEHLANYLASWLKMKEDWAKNGPNGPFEFPMTSSYFPHFEMVPVDYGLVVIDMKKNKIYSQQGYSTPGKAQRNLKRIDDFKDRPNYITEEELEKAAVLEAFENEGRLAILFDSHDGYQSLQLDLAPFEIIRFNEDKASAIQFMCLLDQEYNLNELEKKKWTEFIEESYEE